VYTTEDEKKLQKKLCLFAQKIADVEEVRGLTWVRSIFFRVKLLLHILSQRLYSEKNK
jgi:hypothetical protein